MYFFLFQIHINKSVFKRHYINGINVLTDNQKTIYSLIELARDKVKRKLSLRMIGIETVDICIFPLRT